MSLKVLWLAHFVPFPPRGGALQRSYHLLRQVASRHSVRVVALNQRALLPDRARLQAAVEAIEGLGAAIEVFPIPSESSRLRWIGMVGAGSLRQTPYDVNWLRSTPYARKVRAILAAEEYDAIHVDTIGLIPMVERTEWPRVILTHHNVESQLLYRRADREGAFLKRAFFRREAGKLETLERASCAEVGMNVLVSALDAERLLQLVPDARAAVVENGVAVEEYTAPTRASGDGCHLVFSATMGWHPNHQAMIFFLREVWPNLRGRDERFRITIVGREPRSELLRLVDGDDRVVVTGAVDDVRPYLEAADIYVCPIFEGGGTRLKILDCFASGTPLVSTSMSVEGLGVEEGRHYLAANNPQEFVDRLLQLRDAPRLRDRLAVEGRRLVELHYSWENLGRRLEGAYCSVVRV